MDTRERLAALLARNNEIEKIIADSASTFCHLDVTPLNIFVLEYEESRPEIAIVDWESAAFGTLASDCASLTNSALILGMVQAESAASFEQTIFDNYLEGLREGGWSGDSELVRLLHLAVGIRRWISHVHLIGAYAGPDSRAGAEKYWKSTLEELAPIRGPLTARMLDRADQLFARIDQ